MSPALCQFKAGLPNSGFCNALNLCVDASGESELEQNLLNLAKSVLLKSSPVVSN